MTSVVRVVSRLDDCPPLPRTAAAVVFDVLRATTAMVAAAAAGVTAILPVSTIEEARQAAATIPGALLAGERDNRPIPGFDYGNSPTEWGGGQAVGRPVVWTTTNGTRAVRRASNAGRLLVASFSNRSATAQALADHPGPVWLIAAGTRGQFALEDWLAAGAVAALFSPDRWSDSARAAVLGFQAAASNLAAVIAAAEHARELLRSGMGADVEAASRLDTLSLVLEAESPPTRDGYRRLVPRMIAADRDLP